MHPIIKVLCKIKPQKDQGVKLAEATAKDLIDEQLTIND